MAYTLTQARPLLNAAELALFDQSRTQPVKDLTPAKLAGAVKRARTLRDKYRDLFRRQTVGLRTRKPGALTGNDNERTQRKADILQEVLERFEARVTLLEARSDSKAEPKSKTKTKTGIKTGGKATAKSSAARSSVKKQSAASRKTAKVAAAPTASKAGAKAGKTSSAANTDKTTTKPAKSAASGKKSSGLARLNTLVVASAKLAAEAAPQRKKAGSAPVRSSKAPSRKAPTANNKASAPNINAPLDTVPAAKRASPLKQDPTNIAIQGHQSARGRRTQGKRDSR